MSTIKKLKFSLEGGVTTVTSRCDSHWIGLEKFLVCLRAEIKDVVSF